MTQLNYTKGEWKFTRLNAPATHGIKVSDDLFSSITSNNTVICLLPEPHYMPDMGDTTWHNGQVDILKSNAQLIASAPVLYEALKKIIKSGVVYQGQGFDDAFEALAKAESKS